VLTKSEVEQVIRQPDTSEPMGLRDRAILETFYSTGMRRSELLGLSVFDLDRERGTEMIRQGKGKKDRMVPIGERAVRMTVKAMSSTIVSSALLTTAKVKGSCAGFLAALATGNPPLRRGLALRQLGEQVAGDRRQHGEQQARQYADTLGHVFGDVFGTVGDFVF